MCSPNTLWKRKILESDFKSWDRTSLHLSKHNECLVSYRLNPLMNFNISLLMSIINNWHPTCFMLYCPHGLGHFTLHAFQVIERFSFSYSTHAMLSNARAQFLANFSTLCLVFYCMPLESVKVLTSISTHTGLNNFLYFTNVCYYIARVWFCTGFCTRSNCVCQVSTM